MSEHDDTLYAHLLGSKSPEALTATAAIAHGGAFTYGDLKRLVDSLAAALAFAGVEKGDRVVLVLPNSVAYIVAFLAVTARGGIVVPVDGQAGPERLRFIFEDTEARLCLHRPGSPTAGLPASALRGLDLDPVTGEVRLHSTGETHAGDMHAADTHAADMHAADTHAAMHAKETHAGETHTEERAPAGAAAAREETAHAARAADAGRDPSQGKRAEIGPGEKTAAAIVYTAGSTGRPKGVVLQHRHFLAIARTLSSIIGMDPTHRDLIISPMTHSGGWQRVTSTFMTGGCVVIPEGTLTVPAILHHVVEHGVTAFFAAPPILRAILMSPAGKVGTALGGLRSIETASAPLASSEVERLLSLLPRTNLFVQYGLTECSRAVILDARARPDKRGTVGKATPGVSVAIADDRGRILGPGQEGEILLSAQQCAEGYWRQPGTTEERFRGSWLHTGDFGTMDDEGFLTFLGRRDDMINCGGHSYFPMEVEAEIGTPPAVKDYLIAGVPDPQKILNQVPWAFVVPTSESDFVPSDFLAWARERLPAHMVPRRVVVIPALPLTTTGKPSRRLAVERYGPAAAANTG